MSQEDLEQFELENHLIDEDSTPRIEKKMSVSILLTMPSTDVDDVDADVEKTSQPTTKASRHLDSKAAHKKIPSKSGQTLIPSEFMFLNFK